MTLGGLLGVNQTFGEHTPGLLVPVLAGLAALLCCLLGWAFQEKNAVLAALPVLPWVILFAAAGPAALWRGGKLWLNDLFTRWNLAHDGALSLFQVEGTMGDLLALACLLALLCGCAVWFFVAGRRVLPCGVVGGLVVLLQLLGGTFSPLACGLFLGAFLGLWITRDGGAPSRRGVFVWLAAVVLLALGTLWGGSTTLPSVDQLREDMTQGVHDLRYGGADGVLGGDVCCDVMQPLHALRAAGIPARFAGTPAWHDDRGNHSWVEVWIGGRWYFTEYYPSGLDHAWFLSDAGRALDDRTHGIFAVSFRPTGDWFPMVWSEDSREVHGVDVSQRYRDLYASYEQALVAQGRHTTVTFVMYDSAAHEGRSDARVAANVDVFCGAEQMGGGRTAGPRQDMNDALRFLLEKGKSYTFRYENARGETTEVTAEVGDAPLTVTGYMR